jgi:hypothetical protein
VKMDPVQACLVAWFGAILLTVGVLARAGLVWWNPWVTKYLSGQLSVTQIRVGRANIPLGLALLFGGVAGSVGDMKWRAPLTAVAALGALLAVTAWFRDFDWTKPRWMRMQQVPSAAAGPRMSLLWSLLFLETVLAAGAVGLNHPAPQTVVGLVACGVAGAAIGASRLRRHS